MLNRTKGSSRDKAVDIIIGQNIKLMRNQRGLSQQAMGKQLGGITFQQIQKYEKGTNSVAASRVPQLCRALDCTLEQLFSGTMERRKIAPFPAMSSAAVEIACALDKSPKLRKAVKVLVRAEED